MKRIPVSLLALLSLVLGVTTGLVLVAPQAQARQTSISGPANMMPSSVPSSITPSIDNGAVYGIAQSGASMVIGGTFTSVNKKSHPYLLAFNASNGAFVGGFHPTLDGYINTVVAGPTSGTVYVGGVFTHVNGVAMPYLALLNISTGQVVPGFTPPTLDNYVGDLVLRGSRLYVAGVFTTAGSEPHGGLVALDAHSGAIIPSFNLQLTGHHNDSGGGALGQTGARLIDVTANGKTMVVAGNFKYVDGQLRDQIALINLSTPTATLAAWSTSEFVPLCNSGAVDSYMRGVSFSPDGSYFVTTTKGGGHPGTLCDSATRFNTSLNTTDAHPVWVDETGGDTVYGIAITGSAVFLGGHNRWMNNPLGVGKPLAGAVPRAGLEALDPISGRVLAWNPGRLPLGVAVFAILATPQGLWVGSDTDYIGDYAYKRPKIAMFPWAGGYQLASTSVAGLPGRVFLGGPDQSQDGLSVVSFDGTNATSATADPQGIDFSQWRGAFLVGNRVFYGYSDGYLYYRTFDGTTFGPAVKLDPYHDPAWSNVQTGDGDTFAGTLPSFYAKLANVTGMVYSGGRVYFTLAGDSHLYAAWFSPDSGVIDQTIVRVRTSVSFATADGLFIAGGHLYFGSHYDGALRQANFNANRGVTGAATVVSGPSVDGVNWTSTATFLAAASGNVNKPPTAQFTSSCDGLTCGFRSSSSDADGSIVSSNWNFGDGTSGIGATPAHVYAAPGTYTATLTVTDNDGATATVQYPVTATGAAPAHQISFVAAADAGGGSTNVKTVTVPSSAAAGEVALLTLAVPSGTTVTPPVGWTKVASTNLDNLVTSVWVRTLTDEDPGAPVTVRYGAYTHSALSVAVYAGVDPTSPVRSRAFASDTDSTPHQTPSAKALLGDWAVSIWIDRSTATRTYSTPTSVQVRDASTDAGGITVQTVLADSDGPVAAGGYGRLTATTDTAATVTSWTVVLKPAS